MHQTRCSPQYAWLMFPLSGAAYRSQAHPDLKLWCQPWKQTEKPKKKGGADTGAMPSPATDEGEEKEKSSTCRAVEAVEKQPCRAPSFQDSYISSEHCYQKPRTYYPAMEQRLVVETRGSELEDSLRSTEDLLELEQRYGGPLDPARGKMHLQLDRPPHSKVITAWRLSDFSQGQLSVRGNKLKVL